MKNTREYKQRAELARDIAESETYRSYPLWGVNYTDTIRAIQKRNRKRLKESSDYMSVDGCDNRCIIIINTSNHGTTYTLESYDTKVCSINCTFDGWYFVRGWDGWTPTTMKHVNAFREQFGFPRINKYDWLMLDGPEYK